MKGGNGSVPRRPSRAMGMRPLGRGNRGRLALASGLARFSPLLPREVESGGREAASLTPPVGRGTTARPGHLLQAVPLEQFHSLTPTCPTSIC